MINSKRIDATPRSKYRKGGTGGGGGSASATSIDTSNFVKKTGETSQEIEGDILVGGEVTAYATGENDIELPIASSDALGCVKIGKNVSIDSEGRISVADSAGGINSINVTGNGNAVTGMTLSPDGKVINAVKGETYVTSSTFTNHLGDGTVHITSNERSNWNSAYNLSHSHANKSYLDVINQALGTSYDVNFRSVKASREVTAYATGSADIDLPQASTTAMGACRIGTGLSVSAGVVSWTMPDTVTKTGGVKIGGNGSLYVGFSGGNSIYGIDNYGALGNLYLNYVSSSVNVRIDNAGKIYTNGTQVTSDERLKNRGENITVLGKLSGIDTFYYTRKDIENAGTEIGVSAQEIEQVFPEIVMTQTTEDLEEFKSVDYSRLASISLQGVKELMNEVKNLRKELEELKNDR